MRNSEPGDALTDEPDSAINFISAGDADRT
jgi:hypothetical protein